jgi:hypothetical protein
MPKRCAYPAGLASAAGSGRKYRLEAGVKTSTIDTKEMNHTTMPAAKSAVEYTGEPTDSASSMLMVVRPKNAATAILAGSRRRLIPQRPRDYWYPRPLPGAPILTT